MALKNKINKMEPRKERYSIRKLSIGAASVLIGLSFMGIGNTQQVSAATSSTPTDVKTIKSVPDKNLQITNANKKEKSADSMSSEANKAVNTNNKIESNSSDITKPTSPISQPQESNVVVNKVKASNKVPAKGTTTLSINKNKEAVYTASTVYDKKEQDITIKNVDVGSVISGMNFNFIPKSNSQLNISGNFSDHGFNVDNIVDSNGNKVNYSFKNGKLSIDFSKMMNFNYSSNNNSYEIPVLKNLNIDLSNLKSSDLTTQGNNTTLNNNYNLYSECSYDGGNTIKPELKSMGRIVPTNENGEDILYPFTKVYYESNNDQNTNTFKHVLSASDTGDITPLTITLPKIKGYQAVDNLGNQISSITVNNILKDTVVKYIKTDPTNTGSLNIYPITNIADSHAATITPVKRIPLNQNTNITFDTAFISALNQNLPTNLQNSRYNIIIDQTGRRVSNFDLSKITDKSKDINLFLVRNAIAPQSITVSAGKSKSVDVNSENNYELFNENGKFIAHTTKESVKTANTGNYVVDTIDMSISNGGEVIYPKGIATIPNSGDSSFINMIGSTDPNTGKNLTQVIPAYSENGKKVVGNWQFKVGNSTYDDGYKNIINVTFNSTDKNYEGKVQPLYIEGSSDGGPNPVITTVNATVSLQNASVKFIDDNKQDPQDLSSYNEIAKGALDDPITFTKFVQDQIKDLESKGYTLVSDNYDNSTKYYSKVNANNNFEVHLNHALKMGKQNQTSVTRTIYYKGINSNGETVNVKGAPDGEAIYTQSVEFKRQLIIDQVTNKVVGYNTNDNTTAPEITVTEADRAWMPISQTLEAVISATPSQVGYDKVDISKVNPISVQVGEKIPNVTVTYTLNPRYKQSYEDKTVTRVIHYLDKTDNTPISNNPKVPNYEVKEVKQTATLEHAIIPDKDGHMVGYGTVDPDDPTKITYGNIWKVEDNGWSSVVSPDLHQYGYAKADKDVKAVDVNESTIDQTVNVYYGHQTQEINTSKDIKRNFDYVFTDDTTAKDHSDLKPETQQKVTFDSRAVKDLVTGNVTPIKWTPETNTFARVGAHQVKGYKIVSYVNGTEDGGTPELEVIPTDKDTTVTIVYAPIVKKSKALDTAKVTIFDKTDNKPLGNSFIASGKQNESIVFFGEPQTVDAYIRAGYKFDSAVNAKGVLIGTKESNINFGTYDGQKGSQDFTIYLVHATAPVNPNHPGAGYSKTDLQKSVTRTVNYVDENGNKIAKSNIETVNFKGEGTVDKVTRNLVDLNSDGTIKDQNGKLIWTYTTSDNKTGNTNVYEFDALNEKPTITFNGTNYIYNHVDQVAYGDKNGAIKKYIVYATKNPQNLTINVIYNKKPTELPKYIQGHEKKTITRTIHYLDKTDNSPILNNKYVPQDMVKDVTQSATLERATILDSTGKFIAYGIVDKKNPTKITHEDNWIVKNNGWTAVVSPDLAPYGYTKADKNVQAVDVNGTVLDKQVINVYYGHTYIPVKSTDPKTPTDPINPEVPDGVKYPNGVDKNALNKTITRTINYVGVNADGTTTPVKGSPNGKTSLTQSTNFTRTAIVDEVTGMILGYDINNDNKVDTTDDERAWTPITKTFTSVQSKVPSDVLDKDGNKFTSVNKPIVPSIVVDHNTNNSTATVIYNRNVAPIPDKQKAIVIYQDVNNPAKVVEITRSQQLIGDSNTKIDYSTANEIATFEKEGYVLVANGFDPDGNIPSFDNDVKVDQIFYVKFKHGIQPVNPIVPGKPGQPINPNDPRTDQPKYPDGTTKKQLASKVSRTVTYEGAGSQTPKPVVNELHFQGAGYLDKVTGKWTDENGKELVDQNKGITWTAEDGHKFVLVVTPNIAGYTPSVQKGYSDGNNVKEINGITENSKDVHVTVTYNPNPVIPITPVPTPQTVTGKQTITFVDGDNNTPLHDPDVQTHKFANSESSYTFNTINVPVIKGYVAEVTTSGGKTVTPENPDVNVVVVYHKIGKIVPVDQNHNPIPGADTPDYKNDPNDPTKVVPDEPVPTIDGYTPDENNITPENPAKDTEVVYRKKETPKESESKTPESSTSKITRKSSVDKNKQNKTRKNHKTTKLENKEKVVTKFKQLKANKSKFKKLTKQIKQNSISKPSGTEVESNAIVPAKKLNKARILPQTGENNNLVSLVGLAILATGSIVLSSLAVDRKKRK